MSFEFTRLFALLDIKHSEDGLMLIRDGSSEELAVVDEGESEAAHIESQELVDTLERDETAFVPLDPPSCQLFCLST